jgi:hypothetical protein
MMSKKKSRKKNQALEGERADIYIPEQEEGCNNCAPGTFF